MNIDAIMNRAPVIPVLVLDGSHEPVELAETLVESGLPVIEVTLRTENALDAIRAMARVPGAIVGAGTVLDGVQLDEAVSAGASFLVSPGLTEQLAVAAEGMPFLPGVSTASEIMRGLEMGLDRFKFFPAESSGGILALQALSAPFAGVRFCPTGGITASNAQDWLSIPSVSCVGGSWIVPKGASPDQVRALAVGAAALRPTD